MLGERRVRAENGPKATASDCVSETGEASRRASRLAPFRLELCAPSFKRHGPRKLGNEVSAKRSGRALFQKSATPNESYDWLIVCLGGAVAFFNGIRFAHVFTLLGLPVKA